MSPPLRLAAYESFKRRLFDRTLIPGSFVSQRELCTVLESPMGAVREALKRLEAEGLINIFPQRGIQIADINLRLINEAFQFRLIIEQEAARKMARAPDIEALSNLQARTREIRSLASQGSNADETLLGNGLKIDLEMHSMLANGLENSMISDTHQLIQDRVRLIRHSKNYTVSRLIDAMSEHLAVIDALLEKNEDVAVSALKFHLMTSWRRALGHEDMTQ